MIRRMRDDTETYREETYCGLPVRDFPPQRGRDSVKLDSSLSKTVSMRIRYAVNLGRKLTVAKASTLSLACHPRKRHQMRQIQGTRDEPVPVARQLPR